MATILMNGKQCYLLVGVSFLFGAAFFGSAMTGDDGFFSESVTGDDGFFSVSAFEG